VRTVYDRRNEKGVDTIDEVFVLRDKRFELGRTHLQRLTSALD